MAKYKFGFIGCGNMGGTLVRAVAKNVQGSEISVSDYDSAKTALLADECGVAVSDNKQIAKECEYIFLGVKPQMLSDMISGIKDILAQRIDKFVIVTMAAGISIESIENMCGREYPIIRIMPNTPASIGQGMILYCTNKDVTEAQTDTFLKAMSAAGVLDRLDEKLIDAASALSGCGPAFVYMFIEALADGAVECGLPRKNALLYAAQTVLGSAGLLLESGKHPGELKDAVCSPGGTTIAGVHALENGGFRANAMNAVTSAYIKTKELGKK